MSRDYVAISIKHTAYKWSYGKPCVLWGWKRTSDTDERCFSGYTEYLEKAEIYSLNDFSEHGYPEESIPTFAASITPKMIKTYEKFDTVLVPVKEYFEYCKFFDIPMSPNKTNSEIIAENPVNMVDLSYVANDFGFDTVEGVIFALKQYQTIICELSHGNLSKLTYKADDLLKKFRECGERTCQLLPVGNKSGDVYCTECHHVFKKDESYFDYCTYCGARFT